MASSRVGLSGGIALANSMTAGGVSYTAVSLFKSWLEVCSPASKGV